VVEGARLESAYTGQTLVSRVRIPLSPPDGPPEKAGSVFSVAERDEDPLDLVGEVVEAAVILENVAG
jgi:hypothetical protein